MPQRKGFSVMDPDRVKEIARMGGRAAQASGHAHKFTTETAKVAGSKGGRAVSARRGYMARIGRKGGRSSSSDAPYES